MLPLDSLIILSTSTLAGLAIVAAVAAWSWRGWLDLQRHRFEHGDAARTKDLPAIGARIDLADMKERIKKLEAIASGVNF